MQLTWKRTMIPGEALHHDFCAYAENVPVARIMQDRDADHQTRVPGGDVCTRHAQRKRGESLVGLVLGSPTSRPQLHSLISATLWSRYRGSRGGQYWRAGRAREAAQCRSAVSRQNLNLVRPTNFRLLCALRVPSCKSFDPRSVGHMTIQPLGLSDHPIPICLS